MKNFPPSLDPEIYTLSAVLIGLALIDNFTANEQNAIGNWFITIGQTLENNSAWQAVLEERIAGKTININSEQAKKGGSPYMHTQPLYPNPTTNSQNSKSDSANFEHEEDYFASLDNTIKIMQEEIEKLKNEE